MTLRLVLASAAWLLVCMFGVRRAWQEGAAEDWGVAFQVIAAVPMLAWAAALWGGRRFEFGRREILALVIAAAACRLVLIDLAPAQSDDLYRYIWEGRVQAAGRNPYRVAPEATEFSDLRDADWASVNHKEYSAIYPPLAQAVFLACAAVSPEGGRVFVFKAFFTLCDLAVLALLLMWLARLGRSPGWAVLWAFHPLVVTEFSGNGHLDSLMIVFTVAALLALEARREGLAVAALAGAIAAKLIPLLLLPYFVWKMRRWWLLAFAPLAVLIAYLPYYTAGEGLWRSLVVYERNWLYNSPVFDLARDMFFDTDGFLARSWFYLALGATMAVVWARRAGPAGAWLPVLGLYQIAGPVVHPWYLAQFVAAAAVRGGGWPWLLLTALVPLVYLDEASALIRLVVWAPFFAGLLWVGVRRYSEHVKQKTMK